MKIVISIVAGIIAVGLGFGARYVVESFNKAPAANITVDQTPATPAPASVPVASAPAPIVPAGPVACGMAEFDSASFSINSEGSNSSTVFTERGKAAVACFESHLRNCTPATIENSLVGIADGQYAIVRSISTDLCSVDFRYTKNINPDFVGPKMTCSFNKRSIFEDAAKEALEKKLCSGPLWDLFGL